MTATKRKYFSSSIHDLRDVCNEHKSNKDILSEVYNELTFRKTRGAVELRNKLEAYLKEDIPSAPPPSEPSLDATKTKPTQLKAKPKARPKDSVGYDEPQFSYQHDFSLIDSNEESTSQNSKWQIKLREDTKY